MPGLLPEAATPTCRPSCWRLARRIGNQKAAVAVGHSILVIAGHLITNDCNDHELGGDGFIRRDSDRARQRALAQLQAQGYLAPLQPAAQHPGMLVSGQRCADGSQGGEVRSSPP